MNISIRKTRVSTDLIVENELVDYLLFPTFAEQVNHCKTQAELLDAAKSQRRAKSKENFLRNANYWQSAIDRGLEH